MSDNAKALTTAEVESWVYYVAGREGEGTLLVDRDRILATTRALETAQTAETKAAAAAMRDWDSLRQEIEASVATLRERAEKAEAERDVCAAELADRYDAKQAVANAEAERDAARAALAKAKGSANG